MAVSVWNVNARSESDLRDSVLPLHCIGCRPSKDQALADPLNLRVLRDDEKDAGATQPLIPQSSEGFRHRALVVGDKDAAVKSGLAQNCQIIHPIEAGIKGRLEIDDWLPASDGKDEMTTQVVIRLIANRHRYRFNS